MIQFHIAFTFSKSERLCDKKTIEKLFDKGNRVITQFPFRFSWMEGNSSAGFPLQVMIIVPKRNFPKSTQRNRVKRQIRELYRLHKQFLHQHLGESGRKYAVMIAYIAKEKMPYQELVKSFRRSIIQIAHELETYGESSFSPLDKGV